MTNEIIIDTSECPLNTENNETICMLICNQVNDCIYRQLQRLKQKLELEKRLITKIAERIFQTENGLYYSKVPMDCSSVETVEKFLRGL